ncbi:MAG: NAD(P)H-hydrate dehydratase [Clostridia bacterium]|nr:NAD(P)H-hydrate dehydratase [Clostridia bacterium]
MRSAYTARQMREADNYCEKHLNIPSLSLMSKAALALTKGCTKLLPPPAKVLFLCGKGNNGGDGFAAARIMKEMGYTVTVALLCGKEFSPDAAVMFRTVPPCLVKEDPEEILEETESAELIVDCVYGTGFQGDLPKNVKEVFQAVGDKPVVACDVPSGVSCDDGRVSDGTMCATRTVTFAAYKPCFFLYPGKNYCGKVTLADIGIPKEALEQSPGIQLIDGEFVNSLIRPRPENSHKGIFGTLLTVCGSKDMTGAAYLSAMGALRCGVGLLKMALPRPIIPILQTKLAEPIFTERKGLIKTSAVLVGCGIGEDKKAVQFALQQGKPLVIDADAINEIAKDPNLLETFFQENPGVSVILTPHPKEFARLLDLPVSKVEADRLGAVKRCLDRWNVTIVLKGHHTIVADRSGALINRSGTSGLSKGGSGDVLAGMIGSFLAQGYTALDAAVCGVYLHGAAADDLKQKYSEHGMLPSDLPCSVARILKQFETIV